MKGILVRTRKFISNKTIRNILIVLIIYNAYIYTNFYFEALQNNRIKRVFTAPQIKTPTQDDTILVIAPHPDDETLGPGGYIKKAVKSGADVYVVLMTYGDGYKIAAETEQGFNGRPESLIRFGKKRRIESIEALTSLGVKEDHIYFLGFPDRGISPMWIDHWKNLYRSPFTKATHSPYSTSYLPDTPYMGKKVFDILSDIITKIRPNIIFLPSPFDFHVDHWSTYSFSIAAILELMENKKLSIPVIYTYLVHYKNFPYPKGYYPKGALLPPKEMENYNTKWRSYNIEDVEMDKKDAIMKYKTQLVFLKRLLLSFVRINELWGEVPELFIEEGESGKIPDLLTDVLVDYIDTGANIKYVNIEKNRGYLNIKMVLQRYAHKRYVYHLRFFIPEKDNYIKGVISYTRKKGVKTEIFDENGKRTNISGITVQFKKNTVLFRLPIPQRIERILIGCDTNLSHKSRWPYWPYIDTTGEFIVNIQ